LLVGICAIATVGLLASSVGSGDIDLARRLTGGNATGATGHKDLLPLNSRDYFTLGFSAVGLVIAAGGGIGGGGILVPLFMLITRFDPKSAIALSNFTILGGSISNIMFNIRKVTSDNRLLIDWDVIVMMEPSTIAGAVIGSFLSKYLPDFVLTVSLCLVLSLLSWRTLSNGIKMYSKENVQFAKDEDSDENALVDARYADSDEDEDDEGPDCCEIIYRTPWGRVALLVLCFVGCVALTILKGNSNGSIIGVTCGTPIFWFLSFANVPWVILFMFLFRCMVLSALDEEDGMEEMSLSGAEVKEVQKINWDERNTIVYPVICTIAGLFAGLFGVGGGIVKAPLMLELGMCPASTSATAATMIFFTTFAACVSFQVFGLLIHDYGVACFIMGLICTAIGQAGTNVWMKLAKRNSPPLLSIGAVMALSTLLVAVEAVIKATSQTTDELFQTSPLCANTTAR